MVARRKQSGFGRYGDERRQMIAETSAFLTWALSKDRGLPRIPRRPVRFGGFSQLMQRPMARVIVAHWWGQVLEKWDQSS